MSNFFAFATKNSWDEAVSYTHLDVYKRQIMDNPAVMDTTCVFPPYCSFIEVLDMLPLTGQQPTNAAAKLLDVYKRQEV